MALAEAALSHGEEERAIKVDGVNGEQILWSFLRQAEHFEVIHKLPKKPSSGMRESSTDRAGDRAIYHVNTLSVLTTSPRPFSEAVSLNLTSILC